MRRLLLIPAAGRSNRMGGLPKELLPVGRRPGSDDGGPGPVPILRHVLDCGLAAGADRVVVVTSSLKATALMDAVNSFGLGVPVSYVHQAEPDGLGAAVLCARAEVRDHDVTLMLMPDALIRPPESVARALALVAGGATVDPSNSASRSRKGGVSSASSTNPALRAGSGSGRRSRSARVSCRCWNARSLRRASGDSPKRWTRRRRRPLSRPNSSPRGRTTTLGRLTAI
jgi:CTP:molybdopterin cytidylyltransferase MocA